MDIKHDTYAAFGQEVPQKRWVIMPGEPSFILALFHTRIPRCPDHSQRQKRKLNGLW